MAAAAAMFTVGAMAQQGPVTAGINESYSYENCVQVTGKAEREVAPDEIYVSIVINEKDLKLKNTVEQMEKEMIRMLRSLDIDVDKDLKIDNMASGYQNYFLKKGTPRTSASYQLKLNSAAQMGMVFQGLESIGISNMSVTKLSNSRIKEIQSQMRVEAVTNARQIAQELAEALGQKIGRAVYIMDYNNDFYFPVARSENMLMAKAAGAADGMYETPVEFKDIKLTYNVTVKFALNGNSY